MGDFISGIFGGSDAGSKGAAAANRGVDLQIEELRRQFDITQGNIQPFIQAGAAQLPGLQEGATAGGLDARLAEIFNSDIFGSLVGERTRAVEGQLGAGGLTRSGTAINEAAAIPTDIGLMIEQMLTGRSAGLAGQGQGAAINLGQLGAQSSGQIGGAFAQQGQNTASGLLADQQAGAQATQNLFNTGVAAASIFFSDPRLKENIEQISTIHDLGIFQWDWIEAAQDTMIAACQTIGFMADEVEALYPQHVSEFAGFKVIDYEALLDELEVKNAYIS